MYIETNNGNDSIHDQSGNKVPIGAGDGDDTIINDFYSVTHKYNDKDFYPVLVAPSESVGIDCGNRNDIIKIYTFSNFTDKEVIYYGGKEGFVDDGDDDDVISVKGRLENATIIGGKDNDTIYSNSNSNFIRYAQGNGNDIVYNFCIKDTLQVTSCTIDSIYAEKGGNVIIKFDNVAVYLKNYAGQSINI